MLTTPSNVLPKYKPQANFPTHNLNSMKVKVMGLNLGYLLKPSQLKEKRTYSFLVNCQYSNGLFVNTPLINHLEGINETQTNQPMERIKKLVEDTAKLNNYMQEIDVHLEGVDKKVNEEIPRNLLLNKMFTKLGKLSRYILQSLRRV